MKQYVILVVITSKPYLNVNLAREINTYNLAIIVKRNKYGMKSVKILQRNIIGG